MTIFFEKKKNNNESESESESENENENENENKNKNENENENDSENDNENENDYEIKQINNCFKTIDEIKSIEEQIELLKKNRLFKSVLEYVLL